MNPGYPRQTKIFTFLYHIPSAMKEGLWNQVSIRSHGDKNAACRAATQHFRGSVFPEEVEVHIKTGTRAKTRRFLCREIGPGQYAGERLDLSDEAKEHQARVKTLACE